MAIPVACASRPVVVLCSQRNGPGAPFMAQNVMSPVAGQLITCLVKEGDTVAADTEVAIVEAMKMHIPVSAEQAGRVAKWLVGEKSMIAEGQALLALESP